MEWSASSLSARDERLFLSSLIRMWERCRFLSLLSFTAIASAGRAAAQHSDNRLYDKFELGVFVTDVILNNTIEVNGSEGRVGTKLDASEDLGLAKSSVQPRFAFRWRPGRRHEIELGYQFARRSAERTLDRDIDFADTTFHAGAHIDTKLNTDQAYLTYRFAILAHEDMQIGAALGLGALLIRPTITALGGTAVDSATYSQSGNLPGPTASLGAYGRFRVAPRWYIDADARGVKGTVDRYTLSIAEGGAAARYFITRQWGIEGGYGFSWIQLDVAPKSSGRSLSGTVNYSLQHIRLGAIFHP